MLIPRAALVATILAITVSVGAFETGVGPGEGTARFEALTDELVLRRAPCALAGVVPDHGIARGDEIEYDEVRFRTVEPGLLLADGSGSFAGAIYGRVSYLSRSEYHGFGAEERRFEYEEGEGVELLQHRAEGNYFVRFRGDVIAVSAGTEEGGPLTLALDPVTELWLRVVSDEGEAVGWLLADDGALLELPRSF